MTIYVLNCGDLINHVFNIMAALMGGSDYLKLIGISASIGLILATFSYFKSKNPMTILKWFVLYMVIFNITMIPKTTVEIYDVSTQKVYHTDNVPTVFAFSAGFLTNLGYGLAQKFDSLFAMPDSIQYSKTGFLFGSKLIQELRGFKIKSPALKADMSSYFRRCVVGDLKLNHTLSPTEIQQSTNIFETISKSPSPLRRTFLTDDNGNRKAVSCLEANEDLKKRLDSEVTNSFKLFGINILGHLGSGADDKKYQIMLQTHLQSAFDYYQSLSKSGTEAALQAMMANYIKESIGNYQSHLGATAGVVNNAFSTAQVQQEYSWKIGGLKSSWFLPFFHAVLMCLIIAVFPVIILFVIAYSGLDSLKSYFMFFLSLQCWPLMFAVLNMAASYYGKGITTQYGDLTLANMDSMTSLHGTVGAIAGYLMIFIPWLAYGLVTKIGEAFNSLSHSMISGMQSSNISAAGNAAHASFSLGQASFDNASGNTLSANTRNTNFMDDHGLTSRRLDNGSMLTTLANRETTIDATASISKGTYHLNSSDTINASLSHAQETNQQSIASHGAHLNRAVSEGLSHATQLSKLTGNDMKLGEGFSASDSSQVQNAASNVVGTAELVADRTGSTTDEALSALVSTGVRGQAGFNAQKSLAGKALGFVTGADGSVYVTANTEASKTGAFRSHDGFEKVLDAKQMNDFRHDISYLESMSHNKNLDTSHSKSASLLSQVGADFREAQTASHNLDASLSYGQRISDAQNLTSSGTVAINQNLDQTFKNYVEDRLGETSAQELFGNTGDMKAQQKLGGLANDFVHSEGLSQSLVDTYSSKDVNPMNHYNKSTQEIDQSMKGIEHDYKMNSQGVMNQGANAGATFDVKSTSEFKDKVIKGNQQNKNDTNSFSKDVISSQGEASRHVNKEIGRGRQRSRFDRSKKR